MGRGDQLARQWRIIQTLISSKQGKSVGDLIKEENCHPRTVYRDLEALQEAGFPIYQERRDGKGVWALVDEYRHHLPVPFTRCFSSPTSSFRPSLDKPAELP